MEQEDILDSFARFVELMTQGPTIRDGLGEVGRIRASNHATNSSDIWRPGAQDADLVAIPGAEGTLGFGDPRRSSTLSAAEHFHVGWLTQVERADEPLAHSGRVLRLLRLSVFEVGGTLENVPAGKYECVLRCRLMRVPAEPDFVADWRIGDANDFDEAGVLHFSTGTDGHGEGFLHSLPKDRFIALSFGVIDLKSPSSNVRFKMGGGLDVIGSFGGFAGGLEFDALELRLVRPPWAERSRPNSSATAIIRSRRAAS